MLWDNTSPCRHNAATAASFNQDCAFVLGLESMLLRDPPKSFFNSIGQSRSFDGVCSMSELPLKAVI
jgi:hypothetical protein